MKRALEIGSGLLATTERILDAAEALFARHGVEATSLRSITSEAGVNAAAIHYHFGSKESLLQALLSRRIAPLNQERLKQLDRLEAASGEGPVPLEPLLAAFLIPWLAIRAEMGERMHVLGGLLASLRVEEADEFGESLGSQLEEVRERFALAICRGRDDLSFDEALERLGYCVGALAVALRREQLARSRPSPLEFSDRIQRMIGFLAAGFRAPAHDGAEGDSR